VLVCLDQNYLSGIAKRTPAFRELEPVLREAVAAGAIRVPESAVHRIESGARPDPGLLELLRELSAGLRLGFCASGATPEANSPTSDNGAYDNRIGSRARSALGDAHLRRPFDRHDPERHHHCPSWRGSPI
jgi:hypothetical protein